MMDTSTGVMTPTENESTPINNSPLDGNSLHSLPGHSGEAEKDHVGPWMLVTNRRRKPQSLAGKLPTQAANNIPTKQKPVHPHKPARPQQQPAIQQYRAVGQQTTGPIAPENSQLPGLQLQNSVDLQLTAEVQERSTLGQHTTGKKLLQNKQNSPITVQNSAVLQQSAKTQQPVASVQQKPAQNLLSSKQNGLAALQNSADFIFCSVQSTGLIATTEKQQIGDTKDCIKATPAEVEAHDNKVSSIQHNNPFAVLNMSLEEEAIQASITPSVQPLLATKKKAKSPMQKLLSPNANNCKSRERRSKKHWERELANLKSSTTPAADGNLNKRRRETRGDIDMEGGSLPPSQPLSSPSQ
ncbi:hypothetical protein AXF42_Ash006875 [Apostasia shenzhenica]|uniref:Uncharacterized protein n=1 Tax=Apostasia shenzhenica TaxID=1088818 RepID=A0A2I0BEH0_9ASPA|nr:hypothetical protein AXF42_Ash006875 [Apostasia shenzhenica]